MNFLQKIKNSFSRLEFKRKNVIPFLVFVGIAIITFIGTGFSTAIAPAIFTIIFSVLCLFIWFMAGSAVFRSLIVAGVSLSIIIFLAQTYCSLPQELHTADDSLRGLFGFGMIYSSFLFLHSLYHELKGDQQRKGSIKIMEEIYEGKLPWLVIVLFAIFIGLFLFQLMQVVTPIIGSLCIYQS